MSRAGLTTLIVSMVLVAHAATASAAPVPELDPGSASMGAALLVGGFLVLNGRRPKR